MSGSTQAKADLPALQAWAEAIMQSRAPDFVIGSGYLERWWVVPRNDFSNVYLHRFSGSDEDRALHDHPWASTSVLIAGRYIEHTPAGQAMRGAGDVIQRRASDAHRVEILPGETAVTLFFTGPVERQWGFLCPQGWVHWRDFTDPTDEGLVGRGCGEPGDLVATSWPGTWLQAERLPGES